MPELTELCAEALAEGPTHGRFANMPRTSAGSADRVLGGDPVARPFPVVGVGASAGGVSAFEAFFSGLPPDAPPGMAFVLVQHLAPELPSLLAEIICRFTSLDVVEVTDGVLVRPNCVYVIPPGRDIAISKGVLHLHEPAAPRGRRTAIDVFFCSLAQEFGCRAIGIVLSGTGTDGTQGIRAIKAQGGTAMAQICGSAKFDGMPASAIATGLVDFELLPSEMIGMLIDQGERATGHAPSPSPCNVFPPGHASGQILKMLRAQTGHDFSQYKPSTIHRRIERRMAIHQIATTESYASFVQQSPQEVVSLFRDLLIGVTRFFRDAECFVKLEAIVTRRLSSAKGPDDTIRVWVPGCSTGEEAYSIAMVLRERQIALATSFHVLVFATDIDKVAITKARAGRYGVGILADVSPARLALHFDTEPDGSGYRIKRALRDMVVFSEQNIVRDPPISRLDLLSCRNLLIYLRPELQTRLMGIFYYALKPGGTLFLGSSEHAVDIQDLFATVDRGGRLYEGKLDASPTRRADVMASASPLANVPTPAPTIPRARHAASLEAHYRELTEQALLGQIAPVGIVVDDHGDILSIHGRTDRFLAAAPGDACALNLLKMAREGLSHKLTAALHKAVTLQQLVKSNRVRIQTDDGAAWVNLSVRPARLEAISANANAYLVLLSDSPAPEPGPASHPWDRVASMIEGLALAPASPINQRIGEVELALRAKDEQLHAAQAAMTASNQDLKTTNEEMRSVNEELQSTNEELEASKETLRSINEELSAVNIELHTKVKELSRAHSDISNLLAGTGIVTVVVDLSWCITRFTSSTPHAIQLTKNDIGRPLAQVFEHLPGCSRILTDLQSVLDSLVPSELEVQTVEGQWCRVRIQPCQTIKNVIDGAMLTFVDITQKKQADALVLRRAQDAQRLAVLVRDSSDAMSVQDLQGRILVWNPAAVSLYGWSESEALRMNNEERIPLRLRKVAQERTVALVRTAITSPHHTVRLTKGGAAVAVWVTASALVNEAGKVYAVASTERRRRPRADAPASGAR